MTGYRTEVVGIHRPGDPNPDINEQSKHPTVPAGRTMVTIVLETGQRGQGFATRFNAHAEETYRANGIKMITLHANIDVGGYA